MLTSHHGNVQDAFKELNKLQLKPLLNRILNKEENKPINEGIKQNYYKV